MQPWEIPAGSPRAPSPPRGEAVRDEGIAHRPLTEKATLEWNMIKAGITARAKQKGDYDRQGNAFHSNATVLPGLRMGLPIEDAGRLDIHRTGSVRTGAALPLHHIETARRLIGGSRLPVPSMPGGRVTEHYRM